MRRLLHAWRRRSNAFSSGGPFRAPYLGPAARCPRETPLQPSLEQDAIVAARRADPKGSLRVLAFAGTGKTTALQLLAEADPTPRADA